MELNTLFGLPAHPLIVHAAVVLVPLAAIAVILITCNSKWRSSHALLGALIAGGATIAVGLAGGTGEQLAESIKRSELIRAHIRQADSVLPFSIGVAIVAGILLVLRIAQWKNYDLLAKIKIKPQTLFGVLMAAAIICGAASTFFVTQVGHSGAKATWSTVVKSGG